MGASLSLDIQTRNLHLNNNFRIDDRYVKPQIYFPRLIFPYVAAEAISRQQELAQLGLIGLTYNRIFTSMATEARYTPSSHISL
jgi:hypothetical protein